MAGRWSWGRSVAVLTPECWHTNPCIRGVRGRTFRRRSLRSGRSSRTNPEVPPMPRLRQVPRSEVHPVGELLYGMLFGDRDPVAEPGTASGTPGNWWTVFALVPDAFDHTTTGLPVLPLPGPVAGPQAAGAGPDPDGLGPRSQVRVLPALQGHARRRLHGRAGRRHPALAGRRLLRAGRARRPRVHRLPGAAGRPGARRRVRRPAGAPVGRGDPGADLHHRAPTRCTPP